MNMNNYHHITVKGRKYKIPKKSLLGFLYTYRAFPKAIGYVFALPIAVSPVFMPIALWALFTC